MRRSDATALVTLVVMCTAAHVAYYSPRVVDDLFISLRYAENLAHGNGAVYNVGERVEGYSGPLWMLLQSSDSCCTSRASRGRSSSAWHPSSGFNMDSIC